METPSGAPSENGDRRCALRFTGGAGLATALGPVAGTRGALLDPVDTSKATAGLRAITLPGETSVFLHTGGAPAIFAHADTIAASLEAADG